MLAQRYDQSQMLITLNFQHLQWSTRRVILVNSLSNQRLNLPNKRIIKFIGLSLRLKQVLNNYLQALTLSSQAGASLMDNSMKVSLTIRS